MDLAASTPRRPGHSRDDLLGVVAHENSELLLFADANRGDRRGCQTFFEECEVVRIRVGFDDDVERAFR